MNQELSSAWSADAAGYDETVKRQLSNPRDVAHWEQELSALLGASPLDVLEVGCGPGFLSIILAKLGHRVTAVDGAEGMVARAAENLRQAGVQQNVRLYQADAVLLAEEEPERYDAILSRDVIWTLYDPEGAYRRWKEILRPGGLLLIYDGNYRRDVDTVKIRAWKGLSRAIKRVTDGKPKGPNMHHSATVFETLPMVTQERPAADEAMLAEIGYANIDVRDDAYRNSKRRLGYWKYGYQGRKFRITACK